MGYYRNNVNYGNGLNHQENSLQEDTLIKRKTPAYPTETCEAAEKPLRFHYGVSTEMRRYEAKI
jgi:hypothetical protein